MLLEGIRRYYNLKYIYRLGIRYIENISKKGHVAGRYQEVLQPEIHFVSKQFSLRYVRILYLC